jgi:flavine halogenase
MITKDESGWAWFIPLHNGLTSVGVVMEQKHLGIRSRAASSATTEPIPASSTSFSSSTSQARQHVSLADKYLTFLHLAPGVQALIGDEAVLEKVSDENGETPAARSASDFSYSADSYAGEGWRVIGDAGGACFHHMEVQRHPSRDLLNCFSAFIDPFFSSGVHLAMTGALSAAATIAASIRGDCDEKEAAIYHSRRIAISYTR